MVTKPDNGFISYHFLPIVLANQAINMPDLLEQDGEKVQSKYD